MKEPLFCKKYKVRRGMFLVFVMEEMEEKQVLKGDSITKIFSRPIGKKTNNGYHSTLLYIFFRD